MAQTIRALFHISGDVDYFERDNRRVAHPYPIPMRGILSRHINTRVVSLLNKLATLVKPKLIKT